MPSDLAKRIADRILNEAFKPSAGVYRLNMTKVVAVIDAELAIVRELLLDIPHQPYCKSMECDDEPEELCTCHVNCSRKRARAALAALEVKP